MMSWENHRQAEIQDLTSRGKLPCDVFKGDLDVDQFPVIMGTVAAMIDVSTALTDSQKIR